MLVLVVEDEPWIAMELCDRVQEMGFRVLAPATCLSAVQALVLSELPDVALVDGRLMGGESGVAVAEYLRPLGVSCIAVTGSPEVFCECGEIAHILVKPVRDDHLLEALLAVVSSGARPSASNVDAQEA